MTAAKRAAAFRATLPDGWLDDDWNARWIKRFEAEEAAAEQAAMAAADGQPHVWRVPCVVCGEAFCYYEAEYLVPGHYEGEHLRNYDGGRELPRAGPGPPCSHELKYPDEYRDGCCSCRAASCHAMPGSGAWEQIR